MIAKTQAHDIKRKPDLLLVIGTSLQVHGLKLLVKSIARSIHATHNGKVVYVNKSKPALSQWSEMFDFWIEGDCDAWVNQVETDWTRAKKSDRICKPDLKTASNLVSTGDVVNDESEEALSEFT